MSNMAGSVLDVLRYALERPEIDLQTGQAVTAVRKIPEGFSVKTETDIFSARRLILAAGGAAGSKVGGGMDGYRLAKSLGHHRTALYPSLVQLKTDPTYPRALKGVKAQCGISICRGSQVLARNSGEVLFTEYGVSGPAHFRTSPAAFPPAEAISPACSISSPIGRRRRYSTGSPSGRRPWPATRLLPSLPAPATPVWDR